MEDLPDQWIMMLMQDKEIHHTKVEAGMKKIYLLIDSGAAAHAWPTKQQEGIEGAGQAFLTATGAQVFSCGRS